MKKNAQATAPQSELGEMPTAFVVIHILKIY